MSEKVKFTGNSMKYGVEINGERVNFSKIHLTDNVLDVAQNVTLSGGNLCVELPAGIDWSVDVTDDVARIQI